jgi:fibronectin type 3 domain-containing protein
MTPSMLRGAALAAVCLSAGTLAAQTLEKVPLTPGAVAASTNDGNLPGNTVDGSLSSRWSGYGDGAWIRFDLGAVRSIENVRLAVYRGNERKNRFDLQLSDTGNTWLTVWNGTSTGTTTGLETFPLWNQRGRYLRYLGHGYTGTTTGLWNSLTEVEVYAQREPLLPPTGLRPQTGNGQVLLTWNAVLGASSYDVRRRVADCNGDALIATVAAQSSPLQSYLNTSVTEGQRYLYTVIARSSSGVTEASAPVAITPGRKAPSVSRISATAGPAGSGQVSLVWEPVFTATSYTIERASEDPRCAFCSRTGFSPLTTISAPTTQYVDTAAAPGRNYFYRVVARNQYGTGDISNTVQVSSSYATPTPISPTPTPCECPAPTPTTAPISAAPPVQSPTVTVGTGKVRLDWFSIGITATNRAFTYTVLRGDAECGPFQKLTQLPNPSWSQYPIAMTYTDTGLTNGRTYYYLVVGTNPMGDSTITDGKAATPVAAVPAVPQGVSTFVYQSPSPFAVEVLWNEVWDADTYTVKRSLTSGGPYTTIATGVVKNPASTHGTYDDANVQYQTSYYYVVTAVNTVGESAPSAEAVAHTGPPPIAPPTNLTAAATGNAGEVRLTWDAAPGAISYTCQGGSQAGGPYDFDAGTVYAPQTSVVASMFFVNDVPSYFTCTAYGSNGRSGPSNEASAIPTGPLSATVGLLVGEVTSPTRRCLQATWHRVSGAAGYHVWRAVDIDNQFTLLGNTPNMYFDDCTVELDRTYYYQVNAYSELGQGGPSAVVSGRLASEFVVTPAGSAVTASAHDGNVPANTVDNSLSTRWSANGDGVWIQWDLGTLRKVSSLRIAVYRGNERKNKFDILVSEDGATWTVLGITMFSSGTTNAQEAYDLSDTRARYIRYIGHGARLNAGGTSTWNSLTEVDIYAMPLP